jgi:histidinol-phosphate aminotransferase
MAKKKDSGLVRPLVDALAPYVPGEQPKNRGVIKLNTNENPYPPSPKVLQAVRDAVDARLRLYPDATASALRERLARLHRCAPEQVFVGNGSDEVLALAVRAFVEPADSAGARENPAASLVQYFQPSYSLYPVLAAIHGAAVNPVSLNADFSPPPVDDLRNAGWDFRAALTLVTTPNAPTGRAFSNEYLAELCAKTRGVVVLDEAYADFAPENAVQLALENEHVLVARTFSKAYSLCFQRVGYAVGSARLVAALDKLKDSYNVNGLGQVAALATLGDLPYYRRNFKRICASRERLRRELTGLGWTVPQSAANFLFCRPSGAPAEAWLAELRRRNIVVRWFSAPGLRDWLRITVGSEHEVDALLGAVRSAFSRRPRRKR